MLPSGQGGYMSLLEAAAWLHISRRTLARWCRSGLPSYRGIAGGKVLVRGCDVERFLTRQDVAQSNLATLVEEVSRELLGDKRRKSRSNGQNKTAT